MYVYLGDGTEARICRTTWTDSKWRPVPWSVMVFWFQTWSKHILLSQKWKENMLQNTRLQKNGRLSPKGDDNTNDSCVKTQTPRIWSELKLTANWLAWNFVDFILFHPRPRKLRNVLCFECKSRTMGPLESIGNKVVVGWRFSVNFGQPWRAQLGGHPWTTTNLVATGRKQYVEMSAVP